MASRGPDRTLPHSPEAERAFIGSIVIDPAALHAADGLEASAFYGERERRLFEAAMALRADGKDVNPTTLAEVSGEDETAIGDYVEGTPRPSHAGSYIEIIREKDARRKLIRACEAAREGAFNNGSSLDDVLSALGPQLTVSDGRRVRPVSMAELAADPAMFEPPAVVMPRFAWSGQVTLFAAREKLGKSTTARGGAAITSTGGTFLGEPVEPGTVLWVGLEESLKHQFQRLDELEASKPRVQFVDRVVEPLSDLEAAVHEVGPDLVVVDTLARLTESLDLDPGDASAWTPVMSRISRIARDTEAAILLLHHGKKEGGAYRDSTAIGAGVDVILEMYEGEQPQVRKFRARGRWRVEDFSVRMVDADPPRFELASGDLTIDTRVLLYVQANPEASTREIRQKVTGAAREIREALARLEARGAVMNAGSDSSHRWVAPENRRGASEPPGTGVEPPGNRFGTGQGARVVPEEGEGGETPLPPGTAPENRLAGTDEPEEAEL